MPDTHIVPLVPADIMWITRCPVPTATGLALHQGWLENIYGQDGFKVRTLQDTHDPRMRSQGYYHDLKTLVREGGNYPAFAARAAGRDSTVVVGLSWIDEVQLLLARPGSGLVDGDPSTLKNAVFGLSRTTYGRDIWRAMALRGYDTALKRAGLGLVDVNLRDLTTPDARHLAGSRGLSTWSDASESALLAGEVDVIYAKGAPAIALQQKHGLDVILDINKIADPACRINNGTPRPIIVHRNLLNDRPDLVVSYLRVLARAADWAQSNSDRVTDIVAVETGTTTDQVKAGYGDRLAKSFDINLSEERVALFQDQGDFLFKHRLIDKRVDVGAWIDPAPLRAALAAGSLAS